MDTPKMPPVVQPPEDFADFVARRRAERQSEPQPHDEQQDALYSVLYKGKLYAARGCPFCGGTTAVSVHTSKDVGQSFGVEMYVVFCSARTHDCGASAGFRATPEGAVESWNRRASNRR